MTPVRAGMRQVYGDLFEELQLADGAIEQFIDLLERHQKEMLPIVGWDPFSTLRSRHDAEIERLLGPTGFAKYNDFHRCMGERMRLSHLRDRLARTRAPLTPEQKAQLLAILLEERERLHARPLPSTYSIVRVDYDDDYERRVYDRAAQVLTPAQLRQFNRGRTLDRMMRRLNTWIARTQKGF